jgi:hypothetical protein
MTDSTNSPPAPIITLSGYVPKIDKRKFATDRRRLDQEIGSLVRSWSLLHEKLCDLFKYVTKMEFWIANPIWHSIKSDLAQREMLASASRAAMRRLEKYRKDHQERYKIKVYEEIIFAINQINEHSHKRNDIIHSPITFLCDFGKDEHEAVISDQTQDPRSKKLRNVELYQYISWCNYFADTMSAHLHALILSLNLQNPLPHRPKLLPLSQFPTRKQAPRRKKQKQHRRPRKPPHSPTTPPT